MLKLAASLSGPSPRTIRLALDNMGWSARRECFNEGREVSWLFTNTHGEASPEAISHGHACASHYFAHARCDCGAIGAA